MVSIVMFASRAFRITVLCLPILVGMGCGGGRGKANSAAPTLSLRIQPESVTVPGEETQPFHVLVTGGPDPSVTWSVMEGPAGGSITVDGVYTAPEGPGDFRIEATSKVQPAAKAVATVKVVGKISVAVSPATAALVAGGIQAFTATVQNATNQGVTWSATGGSITSNGLYTAPATPGVYAVTATSVQNTKRSGAASVTVSAAPQAPSIGSFTATPASITVSQSTTLAWAVTGATSLNLSGIGAVTGASVSVSPAATTTYTLTATNTAGSTTASTLVTVNPAPQPPSIGSFTATPASITVGQSTTLAWLVTGATSLNLSGIGAVTGTSASVSPTVSTTYTLNATNAAGSTTASTTVTVNPAPQPPSIDSFTATPTTITAGQSATLAWVVTGATSLSLSGIGTVAGTSIAVSPAATTTYTLTATNAAGSTTSSRTVTVNPAEQPPSINSFLANPSTIVSGQSSELTGVFSNGTGVITPGNLIATSGNPVSVAPAATTVYTLTVTNAEGTAVTHTATVSLASAAGPRVLLNDAATMASLRAALTGNTAPAVRFRAMVDGEMAAPGTYYAFEARHAALMYQLTGTPSYGQFAVLLTEAFVASEEVLINANQRATIAGDSYLEVGERLGNVAQVYDWCYTLLTPAQRSRWITYMNATLFNVWNPDLAVWGTGSYPWSGWSINNPANNYYYSFLEATMLTGLATHPENPQAQQWRDHFSNTKIAAQLVPMFNADLVGGGSREGTGYGTAMKNLFKLYFLWGKSTGQNIADLTPHTRLTAYWMAHATVPTLDKLAPVGDHARDETAALYDYHRELWLSLIAQYPADPGVRATKQLLAGSSVPRMEHSYSFWADFMYDRPDVAPLPLATLSTAYYGSGTGNLFTRSAWGSTATYAHFIAGPYSESHAHRDQGSFVLYRGDWLLDDQNRRSFSGIEQDEEMHNLVRFVNAGGVVTMVEGAPETDMIALADNANFTYAMANTLPAYNAKAEVVKSEREFLFLKPGTLVIFDRAASNATSVARVFGLNMAEAPVISGNQLSVVRGANRADVYRIAPGGVPWTASAYGAGFRGGVRADAAHSTGTESLFLHVISTNGDVAATAANHMADATGVAITFTDGRTAVVRFANAGHGGTLTLRNAANTVLFDGSLPTTITAPPLLAVP